MPNKTGIAKIFMQGQRPERCCDCNLCVKRPEGEVPPGSKFTYYCLLKQKELTGRGIHTPDLQFKFRCKRNEYFEALNFHDGKFPISVEAMFKYSIDISKIPL